MLKNKLTFIFFINIMSVTFTSESKAQNLNLGNNMAPKIIGIMGISGAGKTTVTKKLAECLHSSAVFWDEFDDISTSPDDLIEWYKNSKDYTAWNYQGLADTLNTLKQGNRVIHPVNHEELIPTKIVLFDAPLGFRHQQTGKYIDYLICIDTPLDIALARRLLRDFYEKKNEPMNEILEELCFYLQESRDLYVITPEEKQKCNLVIDGRLSVSEQVKIILKEIQGQEL